MLTKTFSYCLCGLDAILVTIEADISRGLPGTILVGLPDNSIKESKERVRSAIKNSGFEFPYRRITINLSPADLKKEGPGFDLAMAVAILAATDQIPAEQLSGFTITGELSLDGRIHPVKGILPMILAESQKNFNGIIIPEANAAEAKICSHVPIYAFNTLIEVVAFLQNPDQIAPLRRADQDAPVSSTPRYAYDFAEVKGQQHVKRGLEIAAAGGHNVLMIGPPGSGKSMLAHRLPTILPDMTFEESLEVTKIHSIMGLLKNNQGLVSERPFRAPHHTTSAAAIVGGGSIPKPGEISCSHNGVLFLDELPEFSRNVLESLRQPMEDHTVTISRASHSLKFPAKFMLVCAMNPCPCGHYNNPHKSCRCSAHQIERYLNRISGPLLNRLDIHLDVPAVSSVQLLDQKPAESSAQIKTRTLAARERQRIRFKDSATFCNALMNNQQVKTFCVLSEENKKLILRAIDQMGLSARSYIKILKVSRTIADLDNSEEILFGHLAEAIQYQNIDRYWGNQ